MAWWKKAHPKKHGMRMYENCKERNDDKLDEKVKKVFKEQMAAAMRAMIELKMEEEEKIA